MMHTNHIWAIERQSCESYLSVKSQPKTPEQFAGMALPSGADIFKSEGGVAHIEVKGVIVPEADVFSSWFGEVGLNQISDAISMALADEKIEQIVMLFDSPGGSAKGLEQVSEQIFEANQQKKITAQVNGMLASAAYHLASQAEQIFANSKVDLIGSIGTRTQLIDASRMFSNAGIEVIPIDTGAFKSAGEFGTPVTEEHKAYFQGIVDLFQQEFVSAVQRGRSLTDEQMEAAADGQVFGAEKARALGLIDAVQKESATISQIRGELKMSQSQAATIQEIEAACHGIDSDFACSLLRNGVTLEQAKDQWMQEQSLRLGIAQEAVDQQVEAALKEQADQIAAEAAAQETASTVGVEALETVTERTTESSNARDEFESAVQELTQAGTPRLRAVSQVVKRRPELREALVAEANSR
tara:strand:+ start:1913 stop:3151 length:1239 start_codon:yes stop_codon:yes gene_type:complete